MNEINIISTGYKNTFKTSEFVVTPLPKSGSDRKYFRITAAGNSIIGAHNPIYEENEAFIGFTKHFISRGLPVPEIYDYSPDKYIYFLHDLGDTNLYTWFGRKDSTSGFDQETDQLFRKILDNLILFQIRGIEGLNLDLCYPHRSFDRQSMMWDMNYFKYMFLKLLAVPFNERKMEHDFNELADYLLTPDQDYFLYRDFQSANVMIVGDDPWFIDYQGGRKGAPQYDLASFLYDAKINLPADIRERYLSYYIEKFCEASGEDKENFRGYYPGFTMIRLMQALGAFGFRGLYENKPTFTESIIPAVGLLEQVIAEAGNNIALPELFSAIKSISVTPKFIELETEKKRKFL